MTRPLIIASNRGPVSFHLDEEGEPVSSRGGGGLVTGLTSALQLTGGLWVASAMSDGDRLMTERSPGGRIEVLDEDAKYHVRYLNVPPERFDRYYNVISNRILWFVHHYLFDVARSPRFGGAVRRAWDDYVAVNGGFADVLAEEWTPTRAPVFLIQDYHLSLVPAMLRSTRPDALITHFSHTPFAGPTYFGILPEDIAEAILRGMLGADVLGFQSEDWAENFLLTCRGQLRADVDLEQRNVDLDGRRTLVRIYPISIDADSIRQQAATDEVRRVRRELARWRGDCKLIVRVDRTDLSKNIQRGFLAFEALLQQHPEWTGRVKFLALLNPSRRAIPEYRVYTRDCLRTAERINDEYGLRGWRPIEVKVRDDMPRAVAAYELYDVLMVNPVFDGMNLVAMEGPTVNRQAGVVILSRNAGAHALLGRHTLEVNPFDVGETADALHRGLNMPVEERRQMQTALRRVVRENPPSTWVGRQVEDLERAAAAERS
ncbi:MAG TPA: trehalose-6-phosphate synthase [Actinomycetota bacterium]|nr:trehalose-6-phosphate synthase [Actinomycetota bacterium]